MAGLHLDCLGAYPGQVVRIAHEAYLPGLYKEWPSLLCWLALELPLRLQPMDGKVNSCVAMVHDHQRVMHSYVSRGWCECQASC